MAHNFSLQGTGETNLEVLLRDMFYQTPKTVPLKINISGTDVLEITFPDGRQITIEAWEDMLAIRYYPDLNEDAEWVEKFPYNLVDTEDVKYAQPGDKRTNRMLVIDFFNPNLQYPLEPALADGNLFYCEETHEEFTISWLPSGARQVTRFAW